MRELLRELSEVFKDETGGFSAARVFFAVWTGIITVAAYNKPDAAFWPVAGSIAIGLLSWAGGPRIAKYLAPQVGKVAGSVSDAVKARFGNVYKDDERGDYTERDYDK